MPAPTSSLEARLREVKEALDERAGLDEIMVSNIEGIGSRLATQAENVARVVEAQREQTRYNETNDARVTGIDDRVEAFGERLGRLEASVLFSKPWTIVLAVVGFIFGAVVTATIIAGVGGHEVTVLHNGVRRVVSTESDLSGNARFWIEVMGGLAGAILLGLVGTFIPVKTKEKKSAESSSDDIPPKRKVTHRVRDGFRRGRRGKTSTGDTSSPDSTPATPQPVAATTSA